jgi:hypothetical protein
MSLANVNITDTFDVWRVRTNQIIIALGENQVITNAAFDKANTGGTISYAAYDTWLMPIRLQHLIKPTQAVQ